MNFFELLIESLPRLLQGLGVTLKITLISLVFATILRLITCFMAISSKKSLRFIATCYIDLIRGTPLLVQAFFVYFGITQALNFRLTADIAGIITLSLNAGAYLSEIFRSGILAIDKGQMEAARSLGLPYSRAMQKIIMPQAVRIVVPSLVNQFIITLKDTSILSVIGMRELTQTGKLIVSVNFESFKIWTMVAIMYFLLIWVLSKLSKIIERRLAYGKSQR